MKSALCLILRAKDLGTGIGIHGLGFIQGGRLPGPMKLQEREEDLFPVAATALGGLKKLKPKSLGARNPNFDDMLRRRGRADIGINLILLDQRSANSLVPIRLYRAKLPGR